MPHIRVAVAVRNYRDATRPYLFRTYNHPRHENRPTRAYNPGIACAQKIVAIARATSAAPGLFDEVVLAGGGQEGRFMDGGIQANSPAIIAYYEAWFMAQNQQPDIPPSRAIGCVVSVGTGKSLWRMFSKSGTLPLAKYWKMYTTQGKIVTDTVGSAPSWWEHDV